MKFESLSLSEPLLRSIQAAGYQDATPIQEKAIPQILKGRDIVGCAQTGTGKTAAFALPTLQKLMDSAAPNSKQNGKPTGKPTGANRRGRRPNQRPIRCIVLSPTRELAGQIGDSFGTYGKFTGLRHTVIYGGVRQGPQVRALQNGVDVLVATPGRLLDLIGQGFVKLAAIEILILDEADQMLDMGFIHDLRKIVGHMPDQRQTLMFSATMPKEVRVLASEWLRRPFEVKVAAVASTPERVSQAVYFVERRHKAATLTHFLQKTERTKTLVFSRTKRGADKIALHLQRDGIRAISIHGDKSQSKRQSVIREFNSKKPPVLVATDLASRGLDFSDISHVINYDMPEAPETYVHRIGRTARAGASGQAISFCDNDERYRLRMIERLTGQAVPVDKMSGISHSNETPASRENASQTGDSRANSSQEKKQQPKHRPRRYGRPGSVKSSSGKVSGGSKQHTPARSQAAKASSRRRKERARLASDH